METEEGRKEKRKKPKKIIKRPSTDNLRTGKKGANIEQIEISQRFSWQVK